MDEAEAKRQERSRRVNEVCAPIFLGDQFFADGHSSRSTSATVTFVRFRGRPYAVTCRHVKQLAFAKPGWTARIQAGRMSLNLGFLSATGMVSALRDVSDGVADISICPLNDDFLAMLARAKPRSCIDLDHYDEPDWAKVDYCLAAGFPDRAKHDGDGNVMSPMLELVLNRVSSAAPDVSTITLHSRFAYNPGHALSGMSGGPIYALMDDDSYVPVAILFSGHPSGEEGPDVPDAGPGFLDENDIFIRGERLTPMLFEGWLRLVGITD